MNSNIFKLTLLKQKFGEEGGGVSADVFLK